MTSNCHLCEEAEILLRKLVDDSNLTTIEIAIDDELLNLYGMRVPVLQRSDNKRELNWPFSSEDIRKLIK